MLQFHGLRSARSPQPGNQGVSHVWTMCACWLSHGSGRYRAGAHPPAFAGLWDNTAAGCPMAFLEPCEGTGRETPASIIKVEREENGACQCPHPQSPNRFLPPADALGLAHESSHIVKALFKLLLLHWSQKPSESGCELFRRVSKFSRALWVSWM